MPRRAGSTKGCCSRTSSERRRSHTFCARGFQRPWRHARGSCRRRSGPRGSSPAVRRSSADRGPERRSRGGPAATRSRRSACRCAPARRPASCPARAHGRPARPARRLVPAGIGDEQVGGDRHGVLGVEDDLLPQVTVAGLRLERLELERDRLGLGTEELDQAGPTPLHPGRNDRRVVLGQRVLVGRGGEPGHPLVPGRVVAGRRGEHEAPGVFAHERPFLAVARGGGRANVGGSDAPVTGGGPAPRRRHPCYLEHNCAVTLATSVSIHPLSPTIGAEIAGVDVALPLAPEVVAAVRGRTEHPPRHFLP